MKRAYTILEPYFSTYIADEKGQGLLAKKEKYMKILNSLPNEYIRKELYEKWEKDDTLTGQDRWKQMKLITTQPIDITTVQQQNMKKRKISYVELEQWRMELVFTHCYARLDANVRLYYI